MVLCLNDSHCIRGSRCFSGSCSYVNDDILNHVLVQPLAGAMIYDNPSLRSIYFSIAIILPLFGLISNILSLITFMRDRIRFTVCGVYLNIYAIGGMMLMSLFLMNIILITFRYDDYLSRLWSCHGYPYVFLVIIHTVVLMSSAIVIETILNRYFVFDRFRSRKCALSTSFILINLVLILNLDKIFTRDLLTDRSGQRYCIPLRHTSPVWSYMNHFSFYFCLVVPCLIHFICTLFILLKIRQQKQTYHRKLFRHQDLLLPSSMILLCTSPYIIFRYVLNASVTYSGKFSIRLHIVLILILSIPFIITFVIYVLPNTFYLKEFQQSWIARMFCCCLKRDDPIKEIEITHKLWQQRSSQEPVMTISGLNDGFIDIEYYNNIKLEV